MGWFANLSPGTKVTIILVIIALLPIIGPPAFIALSLVIMIAFMLLWGSVPLIVGIITLILFIFVVIPLIVDFVRVNKKHYKEYDPDKLF